MPNRPAEFDVRIAGPQSCALSGDTPCVQDPCLAPIAEIWGNAMKPGIAFIGLGIMGHRMLTNMTAHGGFTLVGGWDPGAQARD